MGQGFRRRPRHADRGRPRRPPARPAARARRRLSGRRARGRDGRRVRLLPARPGRRGAVDRHGDARPRRRRPRRPPPPRLGDRVRDRRRRRGADPTRASATGSPGSPWRRPGFQLGLDIAAIQRAHPEAIGAILGGHGITAWGDTSEECEAHSLEIIRTAERFIAEHGRPDPFGAAIAGYEPLPEAERHARAAALLPLIRGLASTDRPQVGHYTDSDVVLDFLGRAEHPRLAALGTSCPDHFLRTKVRPMVLDLPPTADARRGRRPGCASCTRPTAPTTRAYYERHATPDSPPMRGADPAIVLVPGVGMFSFGANKQTARVAGEFYVNAINVMRGAEALSTYAPIDESEKFRIEYWALEEAKLQRMPQAEAAGRPGRVRDRRRLGHRQGHRPPARGRGRLRRRRRHRRRQRRGRRARDRRHGRRDQRPRRRDRRGRRSPTPSGAPCSPSAASTSSSTTPACRSRSRCSRRPSRDWDLQHDVMARGSFLVSREAARVIIDQGDGRRPRLHRQQERALRRPEQRRLRRVEGRPGAPGPAARRRARRSTGSGSTASTRTASSAARASSPRAGAPTARGPTASRRTSSASSTRSGRCSSARSCPEHVAAAVFALTGGDLSQTTGLHIPVDAGVAAAFLR